MSQVPNPKAFVTTYVEIARAISLAFRAPRVVALLTVLAVITTFSSVIYVLVEGWGFLDAVYFCIVTMSTVGYGDISPTTALGKIYTIFYLFIGIGIFVLTVTAIADAIFDVYRASEAKDDGRDT